jgi:putative transcriptional regulator
MLSNITPQQGSLLLSEPFMLDPNFQRSVILLCEHGEEESLGLVLNQPSSLLLKDVMLDMPDAEHQLFVGGPVGQDSVQFIHKCYDRLNSGIEIREGLYWGGNFEALKLLINDRSIRMDEIKFFIGYSGWGDGQLAKELKENTWMIGNSYNPDIVFVNDEENLWKQAVISLGPRYAHVAGFPQNPMWN